MSEGPRSGGSQTEASKLLQIPLSTLNQKIKRLGIQVRRNAHRENATRSGNGNRPAR